MQVSFDDSEITALKRRTFLRNTGVGIGAAALQSLMLADERSKALATESHAVRMSRSELTCAFFDPWSRNRLTTILRILS